MFGGNQNNPFGGGGGPNNPVFGGSSFGTGTQAGPFGQSAGNQHSFGQTPSSFSSGPFGGNSGAVPGAFGQNSTPGTTPGFGATPTSTPGFGTSVPSFGTGSTTTTTATFGTQSSAFVQPSSTPGLGASGFEGAGLNQQQQQQQQQGNPFVATSTAPPFATATPGLFGTNTTSSTTTSPDFSTGSQSSPFGMGINPPTSQVGLFGKPTKPVSPVSSSNKLHVFGMPMTKPSASTPPGGMFVKPITTSTQSVFGKPTQASKPVSSVPPLFGKPPETTVLAGLSSKPTGATSAAVLFGKPPETSTASTTASLFSHLMQTTTTATGLFGKPPETSTTTATAPAGLFDHGSGASIATSTAPGTSDKPSVPATAAVAGLFGVTTEAKPASGLFGKPESGTPAGLFGKPQGEAATVAPGIFGKPSSEAPNPAVAAPSLFAKPVTSTQPASLFSKPVGKEPPKYEAATGLFGKPAAAQADEGRLFCLLVCLLFNTVLIGI